MTKSIINKDSKKKEVLERLPFCPYPCFFCRKEINEQHGEWETFKITNFLGIDWSKKLYKKGDMSKSRYVGIGDGIKVDEDKGEYMDITQTIQEKRKEEVFQLAEKIERILESDKDTYKKKVALFNLVKSLEIGEPQPLKEKRINHLLQSRLYNELAKKSMEEYKKTTVEAFSKAG